MNIFETVSFHIVKPCNMKCKFCYATFDDFKVNKQLTVPEICLILNKLKEAGVQKVTFAGGEPMLYRQLPNIIIYAKAIGLTTSIITNGSLLTINFLKEMQGKLDWIGLSVDSINPLTNHLIGRVSKNASIEIKSYNSLVDPIVKYGYKLKINTVVNRYNQHETLLPFIDYTGTTRWKVFDTLRVEGQNDKQFEEIKSTDFEGFIKRNAHPAMVMESNRLMTGAYLLIDPLGRMFEDTKGCHTYSDSLLTSSVEECLSQITLDREMFLERGGIYNW